MTDNYSTASFTPDNNGDDFVKRFDEIKKLFEEKFSATETIKQIVVSKYIVPDHEFWVVDYKDEKYIFIPKSMFEKMKDMARNGNAATPSDLVGIVPSLYSIPIIEDEAFIWTVISEKMGLRQFPAWLSGTPYHLGLSDIQPIDFDRNIAAENP